MSEATIHPTWGYRPDGSAQIFDLGPGEGLPEGWHPSPTVITDPARATAEALSATVARATETPHPPTAPRRASDASDKGAKLSRPSAPPSADADAETIAALRAENARLAAEVLELRKALDASQFGHAETLATQLAEALAAATAAGRTPTDGETPETEPPAADALPPARTRDEAREAVRALLGKNLTDREISRQVGVSPSTVAAVRKAAGA